MDQEEGREAIEPVKKGEEGGESVPVISNKTPRCGGELLPGFVSVLLGRYGANGELGAASRTS